MTQSLLHLIDALIPAMRAAGELIETIRAGGIAAREKQDRSPVTDADEQAEALLLAAIAGLDPGTTIVGEEASAAGMRVEAATRFWLVDALDGTRDFVGGGSDYSVNVGLIDNGTPILGLVLAPRDGTLWAGAKGQGAFRQPAGGSRMPITARAFATPPVVVTSRSHLDAATKAYCEAIGGDVRPSGSSLKFCLLAEGEADVYPRFGPTSEWDTAAGDAVLRAAGGMVYGTDGTAFSYGKPEFLNGPFLGLGDARALALLPPLLP